LVPAPHPLHYMKFALHGNELDEPTNPPEAGLSWVVKPAKGDFIGRAAIEGARAAGIKRRLVGIEMADRAEARHGDDVVKAGRPGGAVTFVSFSPSLARCIGIPHWAVDTASDGTEV